ncbi:MAG: methyl-accepting chemotaxis protein [Cellvibrionaceae bacterium]
MSLPPVEGQTFGEKFDNFPLAKKLTIGFSILVMLMVVMVVSNYFATEKVSAIEYHITHNLVPTEIAEVKLRGDINESLAALRGYMILGEEKFKEQRARVWRDIDKEIEIIDSNIMHLDNEAAVSFAELKTVLSDFSEAQNKVEGVANSDAESPANSILLNEAEPRAKKILASITAIINEEKKLAATPDRKALLALLADSRGSFAVGLASIRAYLLSGEESWKEDFFKRWEVNEARLKSLKENAYLFNNTQVKAFQTYSENREEFSILPEKMFAIRGSNKWNMANYFLETEAAPKAVRALELVDFLSKNALDAIDTSEKELVGQQIFSEILSIALAIIAIIISVFLARFITSRITQSINKITKSLGDIAEGRLDEKIVSNSTDEIGMALSTLENMRVELQGIINKDVKTLIESAGEGDLSKRIDIDGKVGAYRDLCAGINELVDINDKVINETVDVFSALAHGNLNTKIQSNYKGDFARIKKDANFTIDKLHQIIEQDVQTVINHAVAGDFSKRISTEDKQGFFLELSEKINLFIDSNQNLVNDVVRVLGAMSRGDLSESIQSDYQGEFLKLKDDANATVNKLKAIIEQEIQVVVNAALEGDLDKKIQEDNKQGFFKDLSISINKLTDISNSIVKDASHVVGAMAKGDLSQNITHDYRGSFGELKNNVNQTIQQLKGIIENIYESAELVNSGSSEISMGVDDLSARTEQQAASLEETAASMEEMTSSVQQSAGSAKDASDMTSVAEKCAVAGGQAVDSAVDAMKGINEASNKIAAIIGVIDEIAFQTNLLALNAAVEAARAGEQGRGFAVVAGEVRTLAQRSAGAAKEIKDLISDSVARVDNGSKLVNDSGETLKEIIDSVKKVSTAIGSLSTAGEQQYIGIQQVNSAVLNMDQMTQQNAALVEQSSAACQGMSEQAQKLTELVSFFDTGKQKASSVSAHATPASNSHTLTKKAPDTPVNSVARNDAVAPDVKKASPELLKPTPDAMDNDMDMDGDWEEF